MPAGVEKAKLINESTNDRKVEQKFFEPKFSGETQNSGLATLDKKSGDLDEKNIFSKKSQPKKSGVDSEKFCKNSENLKTQSISAISNLPHY